MINRIYLDMDGVTHDFAGDLLKLLGKKWSDHKYGDYEGILGDVPSETWQRIVEAGEEFWINMTQLLPVKQLFFDLSAFGEVYFLTSPARIPTSASGKIRCLQKIFGEQFRKYIVTPHKHLLANKHSILIDDYQDNCKKFIDCGGYAYRWDSQWNTPEPMSWKKQFRVVENFISTANNDPDYPIKMLGAKA